MDTVPWDWECEWVDGGATVRCARVRDWYADISASTLCPDDRDSVCVVRAEELEDGAVLLVLHEETSDGARP